MKIWYFYGQYKAKIGLGTNEKSYNIFDTSHEQSNSAFSEQKQNAYIFIQVSKQRKWKNI